MNRVSPPASSPTIANLNFVSNTKATRCPDRFIGRGKVAQRELKVLRPWQMGAKSKSNLNTTCIAIKRFANKGGRGSTFRDQARDQLANIICVELTRI